VRANLVACFVEISKEKAALPMAWLESRPPNKASPKGEPVEPVTFVERRLNGGKYLEGKPEVAQLIRETS
jgi:hypothetical protein